MSIVKRIRSAFQYEQASKLYNGHQYEEALAVLAKIDSTKEMMAKTVLFRANIKYRMQAFLEAEELYSSFIDRDSNQIKSEADRTYLTQYSEFYRDSALRKMGSAKKGNVNLSELLSSARQASFLTRSEFVPPTEM